MEVLGATQFKVASYRGRFRSPKREKKIHFKESCRWQDKFYLAVYCSINIHRNVWSCQTASCVIWGFQNTDPNLRLLQ